MTTYNLSNKISKSALLALLVIFILLFFYFRYSYFQNTKQTAEQSLINNKNVFTSFLKNDSIKFSVTIELISRNKTIKKLFIDKKFDSLYKYCLPEFKNLEKKFDITHWYFINHEPLNTCFLRVHRPKMKGDIIQRNTFLNTVKTKNKSNGLEIGSRAFAYRVIQPYINNDTLIGYIEISRDLDNFLELMKSKTSDEYSLLISKKYLNEKKWNNARKKYQNMTEWNLMNDVVLIDKTTDNINFKTFNHNIDSIPDYGKIINRNIKINKKSYVLGVFPIFDATKQKVGAFFYLHDVDNIYNELIKNLIIQTILFVLSSIILVIILIKFYTENLKTKNKILEKLVDERTIEIKMKNEELLQQNEEINTQSEELHRVNQELVKLSVVASETDNSVIIVDNKLNLVWANKAFKKIYGYSFEEYIQREEDSSFIKYSKNNKISSYIDECIKNKKSVIYENENTNKNGDIVWVQTTLTPIFDSNDVLEQIIVIESDITIIKEANNEILFKNKKIESSIRYAKTIQQAMLLVESRLNSFFPEYMIIYRPKDIVSGDFYWVADIPATKKTPERKIIGVIDCTGHGVPGAFMSMIGTQLLNRIVHEKKISSPSKILQKLHEGVIVALKQTVSKNDDGMDVVLISVEKLNKNNNKIIFSGAKRPLFYSSVETKKTNRIKGTRKSVGGKSYKNQLSEFEEHELILKKDTVLYLTTDGYIDQNGTETKRIGTTLFKKYLNEIYTKPLSEQKKILEHKLNKHQGAFEQRDDITIMGIRL